MEFINPFSSEISDVRDAIQGAWGTEIGDNYKISYMGKIIFAEGKKEDIEKNLKKNVYELKSIGTNIYLAWIDEESKK